MKKGVYIFWSIFIAGAIIRIVFSFQQNAPSIGNCLKQTVKGEGIVAIEPERKESGQVFVIFVNNLFVASTSYELSTNQ